jgi:hypothetical protein
VCGLRSGASSGSTRRVWVAAVALPPSAFSCSTALAGLHSLDLAWPYSSARLQSRQAEPPDYVSESGRFSGKSGLRVWPRGKRPVLLTQLRHRNCSRAAVDTPSDRGHAGLARSAFEAVSATNLVSINDRAEPFIIPLDDGSVRLRMGTRS